MSADLLRAIQNTIQHETHRRERGTPEVPVKKSHVTIMTKGELPREQHHCQ